MTGATTGPSGLYPTPTFVTPRPASEHLHTAPLTLAQQGSRHTHNSPTSLPLHWACSLCTENRLFIQRTRTRTYLSPIAFMPSPTSDSTLSSTQAASSLRGAPRGLT